MCSYDPLSVRFSSIGFFLPRSLEKHSYGCNPLRRARLHRKPGKVLFGSNPSNNVSGFHSQLHNRNTQPPRGESKVKSICEKAISAPTMPARHVASLLGTLESCRPGIWQAPLHFRFLQIQLIHALHDTEHVSVTLVRNPLEELKWWLSNIDTVNGSPIVPPAPTLFITSDASKTGWVRSSKGNVQTGVGRPRNPPNT